MEKSVSNNKPYFKEIANKIYPLRNNNYDFSHSHTKAFVKGCEHVWNTHVVPLQEWKDEATAKLIEVAQACSILESENKALKEENTRLTTKFIEEEHAADHPNENLSYWQYQQFTRAAITKLKEEIERLKVEVLKEKFPEN